MHGIHRACNTKRSVATTMKLENVAIANALQLEAARRRTSLSFLAVLANVVLRSLHACVQTAISDKNSPPLDSAIMIS